LTLTATLFHEGTMMYRTIAAALALVGFTARLGVAYGPVDCCAPPPCGCEPVDCCNPCAPVVDEAPPKPHGAVPTPAAKPDVPATAPPAAPPERLPSGSGANVSPPPLNTPTIETPPAAATAPPAAPPDAATTPSAAESAAPAPTDARYSSPPQDAPASSESASFEDIFGETPSEPQTPAAETAPAESTPPADVPAAAEQGAATEPPASTEESPAAPPATEEPAETPEFDDLFPPSSGILNAPGGMASDSTRLWIGANGIPLLNGRVASVAAEHVVLLSDDGAAQEVRFAALSNADLGFLREQVAAKRNQLALQAVAKDLLATQR
jgi:hypothetical protein